MSASDEESNGGQAEHIPVLLNEVVHFMRPAPAFRFIDGTVGAGGHTAALLQASEPDGRVLAIDRDPEALAFARRKLATFAGRTTYLHANFAEMSRLAPPLGFGNVDGVLLDFGLSSRQLADRRRGFSFMEEGPLDMRLDPGQKLTAATIVNELSAEELADIFWKYGEERRSRRMAQLIVDNRPIGTTTELADLISQNSPRRGRIHPATKVFQALRIAVNDELEGVDKGLQGAIDLLRPGGRLVAISFHSLEDRITKRLFRDLSRDCHCPPEQPVCNCGAEAIVRRVTRKAVQASVEERSRNPRSRSARLRVVEKRAS